VERTACHQIAWGYALRGKATSNVHPQGTIDLIQRVEGEKSEGKDRPVDGAAVENEVGEGELRGLDGTVRNMPGVLVKPQENNVAHTRETDSSPVGETRNIAMTGFSNGEPQTNGDHEYLNGDHANGADPTPPELRRKPSTALETVADELPPEIGHLTEGYVSFGGLMGRLVQETFNGLTDVINDMAEPATAHPAPNGVLNHVNHQVNGNHANDASQANVQKKLRMLNFASDRRAQFIKILVLSRWARQAEAVSRIIDLRLWLGRKEDEYNEAVSWMGELKRALAGVKDPKPDIKTALEVLSLREASWLPELGYLPLEQISPQRTLELLRRINTLLSIRLNLHETIPLILRDFSIGSARATFRIPEEFELDLSIADEDPSKQLYFIDFRFSFCPIPRELPVGRLRGELEGRANEVLDRGGLPGIFDFMHNLVLTHKLTILRNQAYEMARGHWSEHLKVEPIRRNFVLQYWCNRPGGKNWIEIGIQRGKEDHLASLKGAQRVSHIGLRWFRGGKEIVNPKINLRLCDLSMVDILKQVIALHVSSTFNDIGIKLNQGPVYSGGTLRLQTNISGTDPADASMLVQLTTSKAIKVIREPVSGRFAVLPASGLNNRAEYELNRLATPAIEGATQIAYLRCIASQEEVDATARCLGWEPVRSLNPSQEAMSRIFEKSIQRKSFYRRPIWSPTWNLAFTTSLDGDFYWVVELPDGKPAPDSSVSKSAGRSIRAAYKIASAPAKALVTEPSSSVLSNIERSAAGMISQFNDTRYLAASRMPHKVQMGPVTSSGNPAMSIFLRLPARKDPQRLRSINTGLSLPWTNDVVRLDYRGLDISHSSAVHVGSARMNLPISNVKDLTPSISSVAFHPTSGAFAFELRCKIGGTSIPTLTNRLSAIDRLLKFVSIIRTQSLVLNSATLSKVEFTYQKHPHSLKAAVHYPHDTAMKLSLTSPNPHLRILDRLSARLSFQGLSSVVNIMRVTLPLLRVLGNLEFAHKSCDLSITAHSETWYHIQYSAPTPRGGFDIRLRKRQDEPYWFIPEPSIKFTDPAGNEDDRRGLLRTVTRGKGDGWWKGINGGIIATLEGIEGAVVKLDEIFVSARRTPEESRPGKRKAEGEIVEID